MVSSVVKWSAHWISDLEVGGSSLVSGVMILSQETYFTLSLFTQVYKWVPLSDHNAGELSCDGLASHPDGSSNIPSYFMLQKQELSTGLMGHLASKQTY